MRCTIQVRAELSYSSGTYIGMSCLSTVLKIQRGYVNQGKICVRFTDIDFIKH
jgi:predicted alpha-1,6-mannanase (GH76 family)